MIDMKARVGFSLYGISAAAGSPFTVPDNKTAEKLEAAGVADRSKPKRDSAPAKTRRGG